MILKILEAIGSGPQHSCVHQRLMCAARKLLTARMHRIELTNALGLPGVKHAQHPDGFAGFYQLLGCLKRHQTAERVAEQIKRAMWLDRTDVFDVPRCYLFETQRRRSLG